MPRQNYTSRAVIGLIPCYDKEFFLTNSQLKYDLVGMLRKRKVVTC